MRYLLALFFLIMGISCAYESKVQYQKTMEEYEDYRMMKVNKCTQKIYELFDFYQVDEYEFHKIYNYCDLSVK